MQYKNGLSLTVFRWFCRRAQCTWPGHTISQTSELSWPGHNPDHYSHLNYVHWVGNRNGDLLTSLPPHIYTDHHTASQANRSTILRPLGTLFAKGTPTVTREALISLPSKHHTVQPKQKMASITVQALPHCQIPSATIDVGIRLSAHIY